MRAGGDKFIVAVLILTCWKNWMQPNSPIRRSVLFDETQVRKPSAKMGTIMKPLRKGMVSVESLMIISVGAMIFLGLAQFWNSSSQPRSKHLTEVVLGLGKEEKFKLPDFSRPNDLSLIHI